VGLFFLRGIFINVRIRRIIKSELLFESLEDRLKSAYQKWCKKTKSKRQQTLDNIYDADGYVGELDVYSSDFSDPYSKMYQKAEELYAKEDYKGILKMIADHQCGGVYIDREFKEWLSYRNLMKSSDIFQYKSEDELKVELRNAKEKSFTKKLKKASAGEDFDKIWENDDMLIVVPKSHVGACKFGQGTKWCTASKNNNYFDSYYKAGILYRVLQKNDNYKKLLSDFAYIRDIDNLSKVSVNLKRKNGSMSMVDKTDNYYKHERTEEFLNYLPKEAYKAIKNYQNLNEQKIKRIIREEVDDFDWVRDVSSDFMSFLKHYPSENGIYKIWIEGISMEDQLTMMDKLYDHGFQWRGGHGRYDTSFVNIPILYLETDTMEIQWNKGHAEEYNRDTFEDREYETPKTQIPTDDFFEALGMSVSNINESDELEWIKDVKSNQDIAQEIADETKIKNDLLYTPFPPSFGASALPLRVISLLFFPLPFLIISFTKYCKEQYGLNDDDDDINDIWNRYKKLVKVKVNNINESNNFDWVDDSEPTMTNSFGDSIPINTKEAKDNFKKEVHGHYVISTPIENENEETILAFGSVSYVKRIIDYINKHFPKEQRLYLATIRYSKKERDNVLSYIRYY